MDPIILDYFGDWKTRLLTCPSCGWRGTFKEGWNETFDMLEDCSCPGEHGFLDRPMLAVLPFPTLKEYRANWDQLPAHEQEYIEAIEISMDRFERLKLKAADELPDLPDAVLDLLWDQEGDDLVIRLADREVWREPVRYEALWRYREVLALLQEKYGPRVRDLEPTNGSWYCLLGDDLSYSGSIDHIRECLRKDWEAKRGTGDPLP